MEFFLLGPENTGKSYLMKCLQKKLKNSHHSSVSSGSNEREKPEMTTNQLATTEGMLPLPYVPNEGNPPTIGVDIVDFNLGKIEFKVTELGGSLFSGWHAYFKVADAFIYMIDIADPGGWPVGMVYLHEVLCYEEELGDKPFLIILNKSDLTDATTITIGKNSMAIEDLLNCKEGMKVLTGSCFDGEFVDLILEWMKDILLNKNQEKNLFQKSTK